MGFKVGDTYFNRDGRPGVVAARNPQSQSLEIQREGPEFEKTRGFGYINGLKEEERASFQSIIQTMREKPGTADRVLWLQGQIEELKQDPKRHVLTRYLESELAHVMNSEGMYPRTYRIDETKA